MGGRQRAAQFDRVGTVPRAFPPCFWVCHIFGHGRIIQREKHDDDLCTRMLMFTHISVEGSTSGRPREAGMVSRPCMRTVTHVISCTGRRETCL